MGLGWESHAPNHERSRAHAHIAVNLKRIARFTHEGASSRVDQFLTETDEYVRQLAEAPKAEGFTETFERFCGVFKRRRADPARDSDWAEEMATWGDILTHRAKLA